MKYDLKGIAFHPYDRPDDVGFAGWLTDSIGEIYGWRKFDGSIMLASELSGDE